MEGLHRVADELCARLLDDRDYLIICQEMLERARLTGRTRVAQILEAAIRELEAPTPPASKLQPATPQSGPDNYPQDWDWGGSGIKIGPDSGN
jgi:hypothetical protein